MSQACLIKQHKVNYQNLPAHNAPRKEEAKILEVGLEETVAAENFSIRVRKQNGVIVGLEVAHKAGDHISVNFLYS